MACATAKKDGSSRYANSIRARSTRLAGSVRERAIAPNSAKSFSPIANSIACRHAVMSSTLSANQSRKPRTHVGKCESSTYDGFHGIDVLGDDARALAGGHSLIPMMKLRLASPAHLIDLGSITALKGIRADGGDLVIGAMTTQHEMIGSDLLAAKIP